jgi:hypothetical protein
VVVAGAVLLLVVVLAASASGAPSKRAAAVAMISFFMGVSFEWDIELAFSYASWRQGRSVGVDVHRVGRDTIAPARNAHVSAGASFCNVM